MTCREFIDVLSPYLAGELSPEERGTFDAHLAECPHCVDYLRTYKDGVTLAKGAFDPDDALPADATDKLVRAIHDRSPRRERPLVKVNCSAIAAGLVESELFGHVKGSFLATLKRTNWQVDGLHGAARILNLKPNTLRSRMQKLGIRRSGEVLL